MDINDIKEYITSHEENFNVVDNGAGILAGIAAYQTSKRLLHPVRNTWDVTKNGMFVETGLWLLQMTAALEVGSFVRNKSRKIRQGLTCVLKGEEIDDLKEYQTIVVPDHDIAEDIMKSVEETFNKEGFITVADLCGYSGFGFKASDLEIGWTDISCFRITETRDHKYLIDVPVAKKL